MKRGETGELSLLTFSLHHLFFISSNTTTSLQVLIYNHQQDKYVGNNGKLIEK